MTARQITDRLKALGDKTIAGHSQRFFKTGKGEYGEGDIFLGIRVPVIRAEVKALRPHSLRTCLALLKSEYHEVRLFSLLCMVDLYGKESEEGRQKIYDAYLKNADRINNWDLVDLSAHKIIGLHLEKRSRAPLYKLAGSESLWERRIAVIATFRFIASEDFEDSLKLCKLLLKDREDLMHKATGWMLREIGKRNRSEEELFLKKHYKAMPRTMLRYAIERFPEPLRLKYLHGSV